HATHFGFVQDGSDQKNRVGSMRGGFNHMKISYGKVLAQHWKSNGASGRLEIAQRPFKELLVGEDTERYGAAFGVRRCDGGRVKPVGEGPLARGSALDLGDDCGLM